MHLGNHTNQKSLRRECSRRFTEVININRVLIQFYGTPHSHTRTSELLTALSDMSITAVIQSHLYIKTSSITRNDNRFDPLKLISGHFAHERFLLINDGLKEVGLG